MSKRPIPILLEDIWDSIEKIERYTKNMEQSKFSKDEKSIDAVVRNLEIIGEAANRLPAAYREKHPHIQWANIIGLRHRIVHDYFGIDVDIIWQILRYDLAAFKKSLQELRTSL